MHQPALTVDSTTVDKVTKYQYLASTLNQKHNDHSGEINKKIEMAKSGFMKMKTYLVPTYCSKFKSNLRTCVLQ